MFRDLPTLLPVSPCFWPHDASELHMGGFSPSAVGTVTLCQEGWNCSPLIHFPVKCPVQSCFCLLQQWAPPITARRQVGPSERERELQLIWFLLRTFVTSCSLRLNYSFIDVNVTLMPQLNYLLMNRRNMSLLSTTAASFCPDNRYVFVWKKLPWGHVRRQIRSERTSLS